jgi:predicted nucleotidyltransferase
VDLVEAVIRTLTEAGIPFAVIGANAMAMHGVARSTHDLDLLTVDPKALRPETWAGLEAAGATATLRRGDATDPLAGLARLSLRGEPPVDVIVGRTGWQRDAVDRARSASWSGLRLPVARLDDLILLKLYAGGPQDAWDIAELLAAAGDPQVVQQVEERIDQLPREARALWARIVGTSTAR